MKSLDIYKNVKYLKIINNIDVEINSISIDTRKILDLDAYVGIKGEKYDGNLFFKDAFEKGAVLAVLDELEETEELENYLIENNKSVILVKDSILALGELAKYKRSLFKKPVVAITGSAGKTSTKDMIYSVLNESFNAHKTIGNQNNHIGLPLTILSMDEKNEILVIEMGMNHLKEISYLTNIAKPDVAVITNVGTAHIGLLGSRENILKAKLEILEGLNETGTLVINNDNDLLHNWYLQNKDNFNIKTFGIVNESDYFANSIIEEENSSEFTCNGSTIKVPIGGEHFIYNALAALSVGKI
ncbi:MAG: UDP-N-acetylmuramoyl-tripeptide--D-alanyl-D-alanine ligase, partial [Bacilli bacterium]